MKRIFLLLVAAISLVLPVAPAHAESTLLNGQTQYYTVQLRTDKRAIVYARIIFENPSSSADLNTYEFSLPSGVSVQDLSAQQILAKSTVTPDCKTYETMSEWQARTGESYSTSAYNKGRACAEQYPAAAYNDSFDYGSDAAASTKYYYYSYYQSRDTKYSYADATLKNSNANYTVTLPEPVKPNKQGSLLLSFTTSNFVSGGILGRYDYNVRTLLAKQMVDTSTVAINFDADMYSREAKQERTYESTGSISDVSIGVSAASTSKSTDSLVQSIGRGGMYIKTQSALLPGDVLSVTGVFATNTVVLYGIEIIISLLVLAVIVFAALRYRAWRKKHPRSMPNSSEDVATKAHANDGERLTATAWRHIAITSATSIIGTAVLLFAFASAVTKTSYGSGVSTFITVFGLITAVIFGALVLPALFMARDGVKVVFKWALVQFISIVMLLLIFSLLTSGGGTTYPY
jgi:hypothetical protein